MSVKTEELTIIISYYKALDNLRLILMALNVQSHNSFEVIISEDDYNLETITFVENNRNIYNFPIQHLYQKEDLGFRKNMMLNRSIVESNSEFLVFIDGDCIPHKHFVKQYLTNSELGYIFWGRRVMLSEKTSNKLLLQQFINSMNLISLIFSGSEKIKDAIYSPMFSLSFKEKGMKGCNWGIRKQHLIAINGFDEDYVRAGVGEDDDVEWRLKETGLNKKSMKNKAIVYHLYHPRTYTSEGVDKNNELLKVKKQANNIKCLNGLEKSSTNT